MYKKIGKKILNIILIAISIIVINYSIVFADVGSFESYDSGSSGSSWSSGGSSYDSDWSYSSSDYDSDGDGDLSGLFIFLFGTHAGRVILIVIIVVIIIRKKSGKGFDSTSYMPSRPYNYENNNIEPKKPVEDAIKEVDEMFNKEEFLTWAKNIFVKMQQAWTARDWSVIRVFESNELFEQHRAQLQGYIDRKQINVMDRICVEGADLMSFRQYGDKDILEISLRSKMQDYIIDENTKQVIRGEVNREIRSIYKLTFIRKTGVKTKPGSSNINITNCPNCGAPTEISSSGKCEYCGSVITTGEFGWVLSNLEKIG